MAHRFCFPDWAGSDGDAVTKLEPINGSTGAVWPASGTVHKTLATTYATGGHHLWLPHGYRLTPPADGVWCNALNAINAASGLLEIRAYDAGLGARDPVAEGAARARIRSAAYWFDEAEFRAGMVDFWSAMKYPVIDMGYYSVTGDWTHIGSNVWRMIQAWKPGTAGAPGAYLMLTGASAPTNKVADMTWGTVRQQAYTQAGMKLAPNYAIEGEGIWHSYRSDADGTANASGNFTTVLVTTAGSDAANNPVTYYGGLCFVWHTNEDVVLVRNGGSADIEDLCLAHVRRGVAVGEYTDTTANGAIKLRRTHVVVPWRAGYAVTYSGDAVSHCGAIEMHDISWDMRSHAQITHDADNGVEPRSWAPCAGMDLGFRAVGVLVERGWGLGGHDAGCAVRGAGTSTDAREPNGCTVRDFSIMGAASGRDRLWALCGWGNMFDGVYAFGATTRGQFTVNGDAAGRVNTIQNMRAGAMRAQVVTPNESWVVAQLTTSSSPTPPGGTVTTPANNGKVRLINCLFDTSNAVAGGLARFGVGLAANNVDELVGANAVEMDGVTLRVSANQGCALRVTHRENSDTVGIDRSQSFRHLRIVQESGAAIPQVGFQKNRAVTNGTLDSTSTLAAHFNGATAVHHQVRQGTAAAIDSGGAKANFDPDEEPQGTPLAGAAGDNWRHNSDPEFAWGQTRNDSFYGEEDRLRYYSQFEGAGEATLKFADCEDPVGVQNGITMTATELRRGVTGYENTWICRRITCPVDPSRMAFEHRMGKVETGWVAGTKVRSLLGLRWPNSMPFATRYWAVLGVYIPPEMLYGTHPATHYIHICQFHNGAEDLLNGSTCNLDLVGGSGDPSKALIVGEVKRYLGDGWPGAPVETNDVVHEGVVAYAPQANIYHYFVFEMLIEPGYEDPTYGRIYGGVEGVDEPQGLVRIHHAVGETAKPRQVFEYKGWNSSPLIPASVDPSKIISYRGRRLYGNSPDCHSGIYSKHSFEPAAQVGNYLRIINRGWRTWIAADNPGMTAARALALYKKT